MKTAVSCQKGKSLYGFKFGYDKDVKFGYDKVATLHPYHSVYYLKINTLFERIRVRPNPCPFRF